MKPAIVLSGHTMALGVVRALGSRGVPVIVMHYDEKDMAHVSKFVSHRIIAPHPEKHEKQFIQLLIDVATRFGKGVLYPVSDETIVAVAKNIEQLKDLFWVTSPNWNIAQKFIEKKYTYALADEYGVPAPKTIIPTSVADVEAYSKTVDFPCLIKPSQSHLFYQKFNTKMYPVDNISELVSIYQKAADANLEVMLQEIIPGNDTNVVNYNAYFWDGKPIAEFTSQHIRNAPPWWGSPRVVLSKAIPEIIEPGRKIIQAMDYYGYTCTEFKKDERDGVYKLMEVNGRHNLSTLLAVRCGINFPWLQYQHLVENKLDAPQEFEKNIYWIDIPRDVGYSIKHRRQERYSLIQYILPYIKPHIFANLDFTDIKPFFKRSTYLFWQGLKAIFKT